MSKKPKRPKGPIDFNRQTDGQATQIERIAQTGARIGLAQQKAHRAILDAIRDSFDPMLEALEGDDLVREVFSALGRAATAANAKRIANHPLCPEDVVEEIAARLAEKVTKGSAEIEKKPDPTPMADAGGNRKE